MSGFEISSMILTTCETPSVPTQPSVLQVLCLAAFAGKADLRMWPRIHGSHTAIKCFLGKMWVSSSPSHGSVWPPPPNQPLPFQLLRPGLDQAQKVYESKPFRGRW